jgi:hypothetical protein
VLGQHRHDQPVVLALRQAGDGDRADAGPAREQDREAAAVGGVIDVRRPGLGLERGALALQQEP